MPKLRGRATVLRAFYYTTTVDNQEYSAFRALLDWLAYNGFTVVSKPIKEFADESGRRKTKGNIGIEIAVGAMQLSEHLDEMFLLKTWFGSVSRTWRASSDKSLGAAHGLPLLHCGALRCEISDCVQAMKGFAPLNRTLSVQSRHERARPH